MKNEVLTFKDGESWIACWIRYDVVAQGRSEKEAIEYLMHTIAATVIWQAKEGQVPFENTPRPPPDLLAKWQKLHKQYHPHLKVVQ